MEKQPKTGMIILTLIIVIVLLLGVITYAFVIQPKFNAYVVNKQIEAQGILVNGILSEIQSKGYVQISISNNQSITLVPYQQPAN